MTIRILEDFFKKLLDKFTKNIIKSIESNFTEGSIRVLNMANKGHLKLIPPTKKEKEILSGEIYENIKGVTDSLNKQIKNEIRNSILAQESNTQLAKRLDGIFKGTNPTKINYKARLEIIARTERARILNFSGFKTAKKYFTHKYLSQGGPKPYPDSVLLLEKYGSPEKAIPIDDYFEITYNKQKQRFLFPPGRPNDTELVNYINKEEEQNA